MKIFKYICMFSLFLFFFYVLRKDLGSIFIWETGTVLITLIALPIFRNLFTSLSDNGFLIIRPLILMLCGYSVWFLAVVFGIPFTSCSCFFITLLSITFINQILKNKTWPRFDFKFILQEESLYFLIFLVWLYLIGFRPEAIGTEKFMDYGLMTSMMRADSLPTDDMWYAGHHINYYYGGQYWAVFITKLFFMKPEITYNLMLAFIATNLFMIPFMLTRQFLKDRIPHLKNRLLVIGGLISGSAVSLCGNMHYVIYGFLNPILKLDKKKTYWYPDATRFIGYNPDSSVDKTIHEMPSYSFALGDLHAHVINSILVVVVVALMYVWGQKVRQKAPLTLKEILLQPLLLLVAFLLGVFKWVNYWDFIIYLTLAGIVVVFTDILIYKRKLLCLKAIVVQLAEFLVLSTIIALPFTLDFKTMELGIGIVKYRSAIWQLLVLWGLPIGICFLLILRVLLEIIQLKTKKKWSIIAFLKRIHPTDYFLLILAMCGIGLIIVPELVYVRDIYEWGYPRANTMFKLTFQAFILFGIVAGYTLMTCWTLKTNKVIKFLAMVAFMLELMTLGYFKSAINGGRGEIFRLEKRRELNAIQYMDKEKLIQGDANAIRWLDKHINGRPVCLEANGNSYTPFERVSVITGLPTVCGWGTHEWLWRNDTKDLDQRKEDVKTIYTSDNQEKVKFLLSDYKISYIFVGACEKDLYKDQLNHQMLQSLGKIIFKDSETGTYILKLKRK